MKNNQELQTDVENAIRWEPLLQAAEIGVTAKDGIVSLSGNVNSYSKKLEAENAAKKVIGVKGLVENIQVRFPNEWTKTDEEVIIEVLNALQNNLSVPNDKIKVKVEKGWVTLDGELPWYYQKEAAQHAVHFLMGVKGVTNDIKIKSTSHDALEKKEIEQAIHRSFIDDKDVNVSVSGKTVTLKGSVDSWPQKEEAGRIAWKTPGVWHVDNELEVEYDYSYLD